MPHSVQFEAPVEVTWTPDDEARLDDAIAKRNRKRAMTYGQLAKEYCNLRLPNQVLRSAAGYYIGTYDEEGPVSRESLEYWPTEAAAQRALQFCEWTQRDHP